MLLPVKRAGLTAHARATAQIGSSRAARPTTSFAPRPKPSADHSIASDRATGTSNGSTQNAAVVSRFVAVASGGLEGAAFAHGRCREWLWLQAPHPSFFGDES